jgi:hypothetical protein
MKNLLKIFLLLFFINHGVLAIENANVTKLSEACLKIFCETNILIELDPLIKLKRLTMISKMSPESIQENHLEMESIWIKVYEKNKKYLSSHELISMIPTKHFPMKQEDWEKIASEIISKCPKIYSKSEEKVDWLLLEEFWIRYTKMQK